MLGAAVEKGPELFLHTYGRTSAAHISRKRIYLADVYHGDRLLSGRFGGFFQVKLPRYRDDKNIYAFARPPCDKRLEHPHRLQAAQLRDRIIEIKKKMLEE